MPEGGAERARRAEAVDEVVQEAPKPALLIDDVPVSYGQLPGGSYYLHEYAYDWRDDLMDLARGFIDYRAGGEGAAADPESKGDK